MIPDAHRTALAIVAKMHPEKSEPEESDKSPSDLVTAAEDVLDVIDPYGAPGPEGEAPKDETPLQKQQREIDRRANMERRRAKAELLAKVLKAFFDLADSGHGDDEDEGDEE